MLQDVMKIVNHICTNATTSRIFTALCEDLATDFKVTIRYCASTTDVYLSKKIIKQLQFKTMTFLVFILEIENY